MYEDQSLQLFLLQRLPLGKASVALEADASAIRKGESCCIITYGMGVYWALKAANAVKGKVEVIDLRTLFPLDEETVFNTVSKHGKCIVLTEEQQLNSFAEALAYRISKNCFQFLDAPVEVIGSLNLPAVPMNMALEKAMLPNDKSLIESLKNLLSS